MSQVWGAQQPIRAATGGGGTVSGSDPKRRDTRRRLGNFGESVATTHLTRLGYAIVCRNWRCPVGELDIVVRDGHQLVFVEVRTRRCAPYGSAEESVTPAKQARLIELAYTYLDAHNLDETTSWRIDVVAVGIDRTGRVEYVNHIANAVTG